MAVVGTGDYKYERVPLWPNMPKYWAFGAASDGAVNSKDEIHIFSRGNHPVTIWDKDGNLLWGSNKGPFVFEQCDTRYPQTQECCITTVLY